MFQELLVRKPKQKKELRKKMKYWINWLLHFAKHSSEFKDKDCGFFFKDCTVSNLALSEPRQGMAALQMIIKIVIIRTITD